MQLIVLAVFLKLHPLPLQHTPSYENSVIFAGVSLGNLAGLRMAHTTSSILAQSNAVQLTTALGILRLLRRLAVGKSLPHGTLPAIPQTLNLLPISW